MTALNVNYNKKDDYLTISNGQTWDAGTAVAKGLVVFDDDEWNIGYIEIEGGGALLRGLLFEGLPAPVAENIITGERPSEIDLDRHGLPLVVKYGPDSDILKLENGLPTPYAQTVGAGVTALFDGEDEFGRFYNAIMLENASVFLRPCLCP